MHILEDLIHHHIDYKPSLKLGQEARRRGSPDQEILTRASSSHLGT